MRFILVISVLGFFLVSGCNQSDPAKLNLAVAANVQFAIQELAEAFTSQTGIKSNIILSSSGKLTAQIMEGAPYDVFVSADMKYPNTLFEEGLTNKRPEVYAYGQIVLWSFRTEIDLSLSSFSDSDIKTIAIANPKHAPYGQAAIEFLQKKENFNQLKEKLVYGESIAQVNQFVVSGAADIGITAKSIAQAPAFIDHGKWVNIPQDQYRPIAQGIVSLKQKNISRVKISEKFIEFLFSARALNILQRYGYQTS